MSPDASHTPPDARAPEGAAPDRAQAFDEGVEEGAALFDRGPDGAPALFSAPHRVIEAHETGEVDAALDALDAARRDGAWLAGYAAYEVGYALEPALRSRMPPSRRGPLLRFGVYAAPETTRAAELLAEADAAGVELWEAEAGFAELRRQWPRAAYDAAFAEARDQIQAGDYYQINLTQPLRLRRESGALALYGALRRAQAVDHGALLRLGPGTGRGTGRGKGRGAEPDPVLLSRSPELFFETGADGLLETRPMKGTAPRVGDASEDAAVAAALQGDEKNRAENLMIVDLLRNDLSRICEIGSVETPTLFEIERYATVHQMVSHIRGRLLEGVGLAAVFRALFPCGSITGAPKIAAMEAIARLELEPREAYCGAIGWAAPDGRARFNVAIRTLSLYGAEAVLNVGGGVVADSTADGEYEEALWKARFATKLLRG